MLLMNIALIAHDRKKELMVQFCMAYCGVLAKHDICATGILGVGGGAGIGIFDTLIWN